MQVFARVRRSFRSESFHEQITTMVVEFLQEAAVLVSVLGILEAAVARGGPPSGRVLAWSLGVGFCLFLIACMIQALQDWE